MTLFRSVRVTDNKSPPNHSLKGSAGIAAILIDRLHCIGLCSALPIRILKQRRHSCSSTDITIWQRSCSTELEPRRHKIGFPDSHFQGIKTLAGRQLAEGSGAVPASERIGGQYPLPTGPYGQVTRSWRREADSAKHRVARRQSYS